MNEEKIEIKSEETSKEQEVKAITAASEKENPMLKFPWTDEEKVDYKYADMHVWCRQCGTDNGPEHPMFANMQTGLYTETKADSASYISLACRNCGNQLVLHFRDAANPPTPEQEIEMEKRRLAQREAALAAQSAPDRESNSEDKEEK